MPAPIVRSNVLVLTQQELDVLDSMLKAGDRAGFYLTYNAMTDSAEALLQAKIATFSGLTGGAAFVANRFLQDEYGIDGSEDAGRYPGIYFLSQLVARSAYKAIEDSATGSGDGTGKIDDQTFFKTAADAWASEDILDLFPGNIISGASGNWSDLNTPGAVAAIEATPYAPYLGKQAINFEPTSIVNIGNGISVAVDDKGRIQGVFKGTTSDNQVLLAALAFGGTLDDSTLNALFGGVMPSDPAAQADIVDGFNESNSGYNGDVDPQDPNSEHGAIDYALQSTSPSNPILKFSGDNGQIIIGEQNDDTLSAGDGNDIIWGRDGSDTLIAGAGNDILRGGGGNDTLQRVPVIMVHSPNV